VRELGGRVEGKITRKHLGRWSTIVFTVVAIVVTGIVISMAGKREPPNPDFQDVSMGEHLTFDSNGSGLPALFSGWSSPEAWGTWSSQEESIVGLKLSGWPKRNSQMVVEGHAFLADRHQLLTVEVDINGKFVTDLVYRPGDNGRHVVPLPLQVFSSEQGYMLIRFAFKTAKSPLELGVSSDSRRLGLGLTGLQFN
jgi:hypothetical protein